MNNKRKKNIKRKREVLRNKVFAILGALFVLFLVITIYEVKSHKDNKDNENKKQQVAAEEIEVETKEKEDPRKKLPMEERKVLAKEAAAGYEHSEDYIWVLDSNEDTIDFVEDYEENKDNPPASDIGDDFVSGQIPTLYQWDERWGYTGYNSTILARSGCGPTALSMVLVYLKNDKTITPDKVAEYSQANGYTDEEHGSTWQLMKDAPANWGIAIKEGAPDDESWVMNMLNNGNPIIASVGPGDFTTTGHFIVLTSYEDGYVTIHDPFRSVNTNKKWKYSDIYPQMKATWAYTNAS